MPTTSSPSRASSTIVSRPAEREDEAADVPLSPAPTTTRSICEWRTSISTSPDVSPVSEIAVGKAEGAPTAGCRCTTIPGRASTWHVRTHAVPSTTATQFPQSPARQRVPPCSGCPPERTIATATESSSSNDIGAPSSTKRATSYDRIRLPSGSSSGFACRRASRSSPMISIWNTASSFTRLAGT